MDGCWRGRGRDREGERSGGWRRRAGCTSCRPSEALQAAAQHPGETQPQGQSTWVPEFGLACCVCMPNLVLLVIHAGETVLLSYGMSMQADSLARKLCLPKNNARGTDAGVEDCCLSCILFAGNLVNEPAPWYWP